MLVVVHALLLALAPDEPPATEHGGYVHAVPGLVGFVPVADAALTTWGFGIEAGWHFARGRRFTGQLGVLFDDQRVLADMRQHQMLAGAQLRIGGAAARRRIFIYAAGVLGTAISVFDAAPWAGFGATLGPGVQFNLYRQLVFGFEPTLAFGGEAFVQIRVRTFIGARF